MPNQQAVLLGHLSDMARSHHAWVESMGWHNKTTTESLTLIGEEIGEAVRECRGKEPSAHFHEEVADILLRIMDLDIHLNLGVAHANLEDVISQEARFILLMRQEQPITHIALMANLYVWLGRAISEQPLGQPTLRKHLQKIMAFCFALVGIEPLHAALLAKIEKNQERGNRERHF